ncbi:unnamed protein product, partial [Mycena citricolor]
SPGLVDAICPSPRSADGLPYPGRLVAVSLGIVPVRQCACMESHCTNTRLTKERSKNHSLTNSRPTSRSPTNRSPTNRSPTNHRPTDHMPTKHTPTKHTSSARGRAGTSSGASTSRRRKTTIRVSSMAGAVRWMVC